MAGYRGAGGSVIARAALFRAEMAALPDGPTRLVVSHWGFILAMTGRSVMNGEWLRCDPCDAPPEQFGLARMIIAERMAPLCHPCYPAPPLGVSARACSDTETVMSETTPPPQPAGQPQTPPLVVNIQYVKDLSFEVPGAPQVFTQLRSQPQVNINLDVQARRVQDGQSVFEVSLMIRAEAHEAPRPRPATASSRRAADRVRRRADLCRRVHAHRPAGQRRRAGPASGVPSTSCSRSPATSWPT